MPCKKGVDTLINDSPLRRAFFLHLSNTLRVIPINAMCIASLGFVYTARVQINEKLICTIPLNLLRAGMGDGCGAESRKCG